MAVNRVEGDNSGNLIDDSYAADPEGERIDNADAPDGSNNDVVDGFGGDDTILSGAGDDTVFGGSGSDSVDGGAGQRNLGHMAWVGRFGDHVLDAVINLGEGVEAARNDQAADRGQVVVDALR